MKERVTNCCNCGAVMEYSSQDYGSMYKCPYCGTEHHVDLLGRIEEYKVKFMWMGRLIEAYLTSYSCDYNPIEFSYLDDTSYRTIIPQDPTLTFEFTGRVIENVKN